MQKRILSILIALVAVVAAIWLYHTPEKEYKKISGDTQGTTYNITYEYKKTGDLQLDIERLLHKFDMSLSTYIPQSIISRINLNDETVVADKLFTRVFNEAKTVNKNTGGAFDITVAPIINALGFGFTPAQSVDSATIDSLLQFVGMDKVKIENGRVIKESPNIMLDVNAIAQGYSVDVVAGFLDKKRVANYLVEIGGELKAKGVNPKGESWKIGIDRPEEGNMKAGEKLQAIVAVNNRSLATSGNYRKFYEKGGVKYAHSISPKTGYPVLSRLLSATVMAEECITADAYATAFMVMGLERSIEFLGGHPELDAYLIYSDDAGSFKVYTTKGMKPNIVEEL
ncbi:MAG: FAD:protein FMN transferase [Bacteroidales bacterium]|nr:FAD:protein FMN transferase [Bacteroidales bacterium]